MPPGPERILRIVISRQSDPVIGNVICGTWPSNRLPIKVGLLVDILNNNTGNAWWGSVIHVDEDDQFTVVITDIMDGGSNAVPSS